MENLSLAFLVRNELLISAKEALKFGWSLSPYFNDREKYNLGSKKERDQSTIKAITEIKHE